MSADWTAPKLRHATILIKTDPASWCDATRRGTTLRADTSQPSRNPGYKDFLHEYSSCRCGIRETREADYATN